MNHIGSTKIAGLSIMALCGLAAWKHFTAEPLARIAIGNDPSGSIRRNCKGFREATEALTKQPGVRQGSPIIPLVMGSGPGDEEPRLLPSLLLPRAPGAYEAGEKDAERIETFDRLERYCDAEQPSAYSPVYELVRRVVAEARSPEGSKTRGFALIKTDGIENVQPDLRRAIQRAARSQVLESPAALAGSIGNENVSVLICGLAEAEASRDARAVRLAPETVAKLWGPLFSQPSNVRFESYCGDGDKTERSQ